MKPVSIDCGVYLSTVSLEKDLSEPHIVRVYDERRNLHSFIGHMFMNEVKLVYAFETGDKKYYRMERR